MWYEITPCWYRTPNMKYSRLGIRIHKRRTNEIVVLDKDLKKVKSKIVHITICTDRGQAFFNLKSNWLPYQH